MNLQGAFVFASGFPREQALLRKSKAPINSAENWTLLSLAFYNAPTPGRPEILTFKILKTSLHVTVM